MRQEFGARRMLAIAHRRAGHLHTAIKHLEISVVLMSRETRRDLNLIDTLHLRLEVTLSRLLLMSLYSNLLAREAARERQRALREGNVSGRFSSRKIERHDMTAR
jgi:hypothetical protein